MNEYKGAWHGDPALKAEVLARMVKHRQEDEIIKGHYRIHDLDTASGYKGCLIGCTLPEKMEYSLRYSGRYAEWPSEGWHRRVESLYGIPEGVAWLLDDTFEGQGTFDEAAEFAVASIEAIPVGADLRPLAWRRRNREIEINAATVLEELRNAQPVAAP